MEIKILKKMLAANDRVAEELRNDFSLKNVYAVNMMSSPGSGKTAVIDRTLELMGREFRIGVIEGDIETSLDAERLSAHNVPVVSINTGPFGGDCHLESSWIREASSEIGLDNVDILFIENIGNLVCPAEFDTGAHTDIVILSTTEGEDKPLKYPLVFSKAGLLLINKCDLLDVLDFDIDMLEENARKTNPAIEIIRISAKTGEGFDKWTDWVKKRKREIH
ncbi:MAG: hydrogenase nickel incorporation protein HypB [Elusimicrobiota bacterium]